MDLPGTELLMLLAWLLAAGLFAGFLGGLFGIGGGIVIVPALYAVFTQVGVPEEIRIKLAVGTSLATIIVTSIRSVRSHLKHGAVDMALLRGWAAWIGTGAVLGALLARVLPGEALTLIFALGALGVAVQKGFFGRREKEDASDLAPIPGGAVPIAAGGGIGVFSALMGIGGGVPGVIVLTGFGRTIHQAIATAAGFGLAVAVPGAVGYMAVGWGAEGLPPASLGFVSLPAFAIIAAMTFLTAPLGADAAHRLDRVLLNRVFAAYLALTALILLREALT